MEKKPINSNNLEVSKETVKKKDNIGSIKQNQEKPAWELTEEQQKNINERAVEEVKRYPYTTSNEQQKDNNNSHDEDEFGSY